MIVYDINSYVETDSDFLTVAGVDEITFRPAIGYENDASPLVIYLWNPGIQAPESFFIREDVIIYRIYDVDADRCFRISEDIIRLLNVTDGIQTVSSTDYIPKWMYLRRSSMEQPSEREGYYYVTLEFVLGYVQKS